VRKSAIRHCLTWGAGVRGYAVMCFTSALLLAGCGSSAAPKTASPTPTLSPAGTVTPPIPSLTTHPTPVSTPGRYKEAYVNAFEDFWVAYAQADYAASPNSPLLSDVASGAALAWARKQIHDHVALGVTHKGTAHFRSVGAEHVTASSALVGQCMDWSGWPVVNRTTGAAFQQFARYSQLVSGQVVLTAGRWKVATIQVQAAAC
jgi:hypothetical protein